MNNTEVDIKNLKKKLKKNNSKLGRGLSSLLGDDNNPKDSDEKVMFVDIEKLVANIEQPRKKFDQDKLESLSLSIKEKGIIQPIVVRRYNDKYQIIAGERRWRAANLANLTKVPIVIYDLSDKEVLEISLIENLHRDDISVIEEANAYMHLINDFNYTHDQLATAMSKSRSYITNYLRILNLPKEVILLLEEKKLSFGHARALVASNNPLELAKYIIDNNLSVRQAEVLVKKELESKVNNKNINKSSNNISIDDKNKIESKIHAIFPNSKVKVRLDHKGESVITIKVKDLKNF